MKEGSLGKPAIRVEALVKIYAGKKVAVDRVSFTVKRGEIFGLLGPNSAGKSTIVKCLTTIVRPTSGIAEILGHNVLSDPLSVRKQIGVVLQENAVEMLLSVSDNLKIYGQLHLLSGRDLQRRIDRVMETFGLREFQKEKAQDLSLGYRRRLQVAKVFLIDSPVIFLDEATTAMDPIIRRSTIDAISMEAKNGRTVFLTTQVLDEARELCDTFLIINKGRIIAGGDLDRLRSLATRKFHVSLTFESITQQVERSLIELQPVSLKITGDNAEMVFVAEEATVLERLAALSHKTAIRSVEMRGADLEDIFLELLGKEEQS